MTLSNCDKAIATTRFLKPLKIYNSLLGTLSNNLLHYYACSLDWKSFVGIARYHVMAEHGVESSDPESVSADQCIN